MSERIRLRPRMVLTLVAALVACGSIEPPPEDTTETAQRTKPPPEGPVSAAADTSASAAPGPDNGNRAQRLAKNLLEGWVGWHPGRKAFIVITSFTQEGDGAGVIAAVATEKAGYEDEGTLCKPGEGCEATRDELLQKATAWIEEKQLTGALAIEAIDVKPGAGFPSADVGALGGKLVWKRDHYDLVRGANVTSLPKLEFSKEFKVTPSQVAASPDGSFVVCLFDMAPGAGYAKGFNAHVDVKVQRVP